MMGGLWIELARGPYESTVVVFSQKGAKLRAAVRTLLSSDGFERGVVGAVWKDAPHGRIDCIRDRG